MYMFCSVSTAMEAMEAMEAMDHRQDVSWFDLKEVAALPSEINDDLEPLNEGAVRSHWVPSGYVKIAIENDH